MLVNWIVASKRSQSAIAATLVAAVVSGWVGFVASRSQPVVTPATVRAAIANGITPPAVELAIEKLIKLWEGVDLIAYRDLFGVPTICWGETKGVVMGMRKTEEFALPDVPCRS